jgi:predicted GIY-YIG superfamily endonuclease
LYYQSFDEVVQAINREKQLKGWVGRKKIALIESVNPDKWGTQMLVPSQSTKER